MTNHTPRCPTSQSNAQEPTTKAQTDSDLLQQLLNLQVGDSARLDLVANDASGYIHDAHHPDNIYRVERTEVKHTTNGAEAFFVIHLGCAGVPSLADPMFSITVSRNVIHQHGRTRDNACWQSHWVCYRTGYSFGTVSWSAPKGKVADIEIIDD